jgi:arginase
MNTAGRRRPALIGVPFDGPDAAVEPDLVVPGPVPQRAAGSGLLNERALLPMLGALHRRVHALLSAGRFPLVYGADCSVLLAAVPALRDIAGRAGLVFLDGHEDATPMDLSLTVAADGLPRS